jgi:hypothetical protein
MSRTVSLTIECIDLPPADWGGHAEIWLGIQRGQEVEQAVKLPAERITFHAELRLEGEPPKAPNFLGPYSQGTAQDRFVYLNWGRRQSGIWVGFRRVKLRLSHLTWDDLAAGALKVALKCTDAKGGPICATIPATHLKWEHN